MIHANHTALTHGGCRKNLTQSINTKMISKEVFDVMLVACQLRVKQGREGKWSRRKTAGVATQWVLDTLLLHMREAGVKPDGA